MAAIDFPNSPVLNQQFSSANGITYQWSGVQWIAISGPSAYLPLVGGTLSGNVTAPAFIVPGGGGVYAPGAVNGYVELHDGSGRAAGFLGGSAVDTNVWRNDHHLFQNLAGVTWAFIQNGSFGLGSGVGGGLLLSDWSYFTANTGSIAPLTTWTQGLAIGWNYSAGSGEVNYVARFASLTDHRFQHWDGTVMTWGGIASGNVQINQPQYPALLWHSELGVTNAKWYSLLIDDGGNARFRYYNDALGAPIDAVIWTRSGTTPLNMVVASPITSSPVAGTAPEFGLQSAGVAYWKIKVNPAGNLIFNNTTVGDVVAFNLAGPGIFVGNTITIQGDAINGAIEMGVANATPYFDWHSGASFIDYDFRMQAFGGTGTPGAGSISFIGAYLAMNGVLGANVGATPAGGAQAFQMSSVNAFGLYFSSGAPTVSAPLGSLNLDRTGAPWFNNNGSTGWSQLGVTPGVTNAQTGTAYTLVASDNGGVVTMNNASANVVTAPTGLPANFSVAIVQIGAGQTSVAAGSGATVHASVGLKCRAQWSPISVVTYATSSFIVSGDTAP
jgi:hypothetical protein